MHRVAQVEQAVTENLFEVQYTDELKLSSYGSAGLMLDTRV